MTQISSSKPHSSALTALGAVAEVLVPGDDGYAGTAATLFADGTPDLVVRPLDAAGVAAALRYATAFAHRNAEVMLAAAFLLPRPAPPGRLDQALNQWSPVAALGSGAYVGFLGSSGPADVAAAYPPDPYRRLAEVKPRYDPGTVFRRTHTILPGA